MRRLLCLLAIALCSPAAHADVATDAAAIEALALGIAAKTDARVAAVLPRIEGAGSKLLALRSYLRSGGRLAERWSWSQEQIAAYEGSTEQHELNAEIQRVREAFEHSNPGFELFVNPQVRSLDIQLANWNRNESVAAASARLLQDAVAHLGTAATDALRATPMLEAFLQSYSPDADSNRSRARAVASWADARDRFPGTPRRGDRRRARHANDRDGLGAGWLGCQAGPGGARGEQQVRRPARFAARAVALHLRPGRHRRPVSPCRLPSRADTRRFDPRRRSATMRAYSFIRN